MEKQSQRDPTSFVKQNAHRRCTTVACSNSELGESGDVRCHREISPLAWCTTELVRSLFLLLFLADTVVSRPGKENFKEKHKKEALLS